MRQIGEGRRRQAKPVETMLVETVARRLDGQVRDAFACEYREILVELHRIGSREASLPREPRRDDAQRSHARRPQAKRRPYLAHEMDDRGLAVGPGHRGDRGRLEASVGGRHQCDAAARIGVTHDNDAGIEGRQPRIGCCEDRDSTPIHGVRDKCRPIVVRSRQRREQVAGPDFARIERQAGENGVARQRWKGCDLVCAPAHELTQSQRDALPSRVPPRSGLHRIALPGPCAAPPRATAHSPARTAAQPPARALASTRSRSAAGLP